MTKIELWEILDTGSDGYGTHIEFVSASVPLEDVRKYAKLKYAIPQGLLLMSEVEGWTNRGIGIQLYTKDFSETTFATVHAELPKLEEVARLTAEIKKIQKY